MLEQLLINSDLEAIMKIVLIVFLVCLGALSLGYGLSALFLDDDKFLGILTLIVAIISIGGTYISVTNLKNKLTKLKPSKKVTSKIITTSQKMEKPLSSHSKMINQNGYKHKLKRKSSTKIIKPIKSNTKTQLTVYQNPRSSRKETAYGKL